MFEFDKIYCPKICFSFEKIFLPGNPTNSPLGLLTCDVMRIFFTLFQSFLKFKVFTHQEHEYIIFFGNSLRFLKFKGVREKWLGKKGGF